MKKFSRRRFLSALATAPWVHTTAAAGDVVVIGAGSVATDIVTNPDDETIAIDGNHP